MTNTDRPLTEKEFAQFKAQVARAEEVQLMEQLAGEVIVLREENQILKTYVKALEELRESLLGKVQKLNGDLETLQAHMITR